MMSEFWLSVGDKTNAFQFVYAILVGAQRACLQMGMRISSSGAVTQRTGIMRKVALKCTQVIKYLIKALHCILSHFRMLLARKLLKL